MSFRELKRVSVVVVHEIETVTDDDESYDREMIQVNDETMFFDDDYAIARAIRESLK